MAGKGEAKGREGQLPVHGRPQHRSGLIVDHPTGKSAKLVQPPEVSICMLLSCTLAQPLGAHAVLLNQTFAD
jgi:hypothetical protein